MKGLFATVVVFGLIWGSVLLIVGIVRTRNSRNKSSKQKQDENK